MDRTSIKVLKYIKKNAGSVRSEQIIEKFGSNGVQSLSMLYREGYLSRSFAGTGAKEILCNIYRLQPAGRDFLEHKFWNDFDKWVTRGAAFVGFITGVTSLFLHIIGYNAG